MKSLRTFLCLAASAALFGMGCGGAPEETPAPSEPQPTVETPEVRQQGTYSVCWPALGVYQSPSTSSWKLVTLYSGNGDFFVTDSSVFWSNGEYWVRGTGYCGNGSGDCWAHGYVRWDGLCH